MLGMAVGLVVLSAVVHAGWNAGVKGLADPEAGALAVVAGAALISGLVALLAGQTRLPGASVGWVLASGLVEGVYFVSLSRALARLPLGTAYGLSRGGGQLLVWPLSVGLMGERLSVVGALGAAVLSAGLWLRVRAPWLKPGMGWAALCAVAIGAYPLTYQQALKAGAPAFLLFAASLGLCLPLQVVALGGGAGRLVALWPRRWALLGLALACAVSFWCFLGALSLSGAGRVSALRNLSIVFATGLGLLQGEKLGAREAWAAVLICVGAVLVGAG